MEIDPERYVRGIGDAVVFAAIGRVRPQLPGRRDEIRRGEAPFVMLENHLMVGMDRVGEFHGLWCLWRESVGIVRSRHALAAGGSEEGIPFLAGEGDLVGLSAGADAVGLGRADDRLNAGGMVENPREQDALGGGGLGLREFGDEVGGGVKRVRGGGVGGSAEKLAASDGGPRLHGDFVQAAVVEQAGGKGGSRAGAALVGAEALGNERVLGEGELELVGDERLAEMAAEQLDLAGRVVAHAEMADLAGGLQRIEGAGDLGGLDERVGAVEEQDVEVGNLKAAQDGLGGADDMAVAEVVARGFSA